MSTIDRVNSAKQDGVLPVLQVGDTVERGPDWRWDTQDEFGGSRRWRTARGSALLPLPLMRFVPTDYDP